MKSKNERYLYWMNNESINDNNTTQWHAYNMNDEHVGTLKYEKVGMHMHWCWYQPEDVSMSPGCLEEVRTQQKTLWNVKNKKVTQ